MTSIRFHHWVSHQGSDAAAIRHATEHKNSRRRLHSAGCLKRLRECRVAAASETGGRGPRSSAARVGFRALILLHRIKARCLQGRSRCRTKPSPRERRREWSLQKRNRQMPHATLSVVTEQCPSGRRAQQAPVTDLKNRGPAPVTTRNRQFMAAIRTNPRRRHHARQYRDNEGV